MEAATNESDEMKTNVAAGETVSVASRVKFKEVASLLERLAKIDETTLGGGRAQGKNDVKKGELQSFMQNWRSLAEKLKTTGQKVDDNFFPVMRLLLPGDDRRTYGLKEVKLAKSLCENLCIGLKTDDGQKLINYRYNYHFNRMHSDAAHELLIQNIYMGFGSIYLWSDNIWV